ncbi:MAG: molybdopterin molybdotransferase MoeA [Chloroflexi bacterium]|nr:molybdopterin molybdotransferase MoeA [Chloroflexota bacterium]
MMSVEEALERILAQVDILSTAEVSLADALDRVLAEDIDAPFDIPQVANSGMDGYAVRAEDIRNASAHSPVVLPITGQIAAGYVAEGALAPGATMRIMTGAPIPEGADTVVPFEETDELDRRRGGPARPAGGLASGLREIGVRVALPRGVNVRPAGEDVRKGARVLRRGELLRAAHLGVLASLGKATVRVIRPAVVAILSTGDELREPGEPLGPGQIYNSNSYTLAALTRACGATPLVLPIARDNVEDLTAKIASGLDADLFITSAGVSTGEYDLVKDVLTRRGSMDFWRVRMRPGRPLAFGMLRRPDGSQVPHLGLPGNTVSTLITFDQFVRPAIFKMMGKPLIPHPTIHAVLEEPFQNRDGRRCFVRAVVEKRGERFYARLTGSQGSNILTSMVLANGLLVVPEDRARVEVGEEATVQLLEGYESLLFS